MTTASPAARQRRQRRKRDEDGSDPAIHRLARRRARRNDEAARQRSPTSPWKRKATAGRASPPMVTFKGQIEGRVILDMEPRAAAQVASYLAGGEVDSRRVDRPGNRLRARQHGHRQRRHQLNDRGFQFKVLPPALLSEEQCAKDRAGFRSDDPVFRNARAATCTSISPCTTTHAAPASASVAV